MPLLRRAAVAEDAADAVADAPLPAAPAVVFLAPVLLPAALLLLLLLLLHNVMATISHIFI